MNEELAKQLEELGLSQKEARVYLASLSTGPASVQRIADQSGIKRVTTYVILESLINLGLVSQSTKGKKTSFTAEDPVSLERLLEKKQQQLAEQKQNFEDILPQLKSLRNLPQDAPNVKFYAGLEGIKSVAYTLLPDTFKKMGNRGTAFGISNLDHLYQVFPEFKESLGNPTRIKSGVKSRYIYTYSGGPVLKASDKLKNRQSLYLPPDQFPFNGDISIAGDVVEIFSFTGTKPMAIVIQSEEIAKAMRAIFDMAWQTAQQQSIS